MAQLMVVFTTVPDEETGARIARTLVEERLAACVNVVPGLRSFYRWQGTLEDDDEALLVAKVRAEDFEAYAERMTALHPYAVPEIVALPAERVAEAYLSWAIEQTDRSGGDPAAGVSGGAGGP